MTDDVEVKFGAETGEATSAITQLREALQGLTNPIRGIHANLGELAEAFVAAFAVEKIAEFVEKMAELGTQTERTAAMLGITTEEVGRFSALGVATGTSVDGMSHTMERLALSLAHAKEGTGPAAAGLRALGLSAKELQGLPLPEVLDKIADKFHGWQDGTNKTAIAMALLGRQGAQMIPVLDRGADGMKELASMADRAGTALDHATVASLAQMHEGLVEMGLALQGISVSTVSYFTPAINAIVGGLTDMLEWFNRSIKAGGIFEDVMKVLALAADLLAAGFLTVAYSIQVVAEGIVLGLKMIRDAVTFNLDGAKKDFADFQKNMEADTAAFLKRMNALTGSAHGGEHSDKKPSAPTLDLSSGNPAALATKALDAEIKVLQQGLIQKKLILDQEVAQKQITEDQKYDALEQATHKEYWAEMDLMQKQLVLWGTGTTQYAAIKAKMLEAGAKYDTAMIKLDGEAVAAQTKIWQGYLSTVQGAWDGQLRGLLAGTTSFTQAMKSIFGDLIIAVIQHFEKMGIEWVAAQLGMTTATTTGAAARAAAEQAATTTTLPARALKFSSDIAADAALTFAGIFASMAPILGPGAAAPAAAGQATVLAELANIPKFDVGTPYVMKTGLAMIHEGEKITPAQGSGPYTGGDGGDTHHHWHISTFDGPSLSRFIKNNAGVFNDALRTNSRMTPSSK